MPMIGLCHMFIIVAAIIVRKSGFVLSYNVATLQQDVQLVLSIELHFMK